MNEPKAGAASPLQNEWQDFIADIEDLVRQVGGLDDADIARVRERITASLTGIKAQLADSAEHARDVAGTVDDYVHDKPWQSLGVAAVAGLLFGLMLSSRD